MIELYYNSYSVAYFVVSQEMGTKTQMEFLESLYEQEYEFLHPVYKGDKKAFIGDNIAVSNPRTEGYLLIKEIYLDWRCSTETRVSFTTHWDIKQRWGGKSMNRDRVINAAIDYCNGKGLSAKMLLLGERVNNSKSVKQDKIRLYV